MSKESENEDDPVVNFWLGLFLLSFLLIFFNICFICGSWRKEFNKLEEFEVNGKMVKIATENEILAEKERDPREAGVVKTYGIRKNCYYKNEADCTWLKGFGFVGDEAILIMLCIALCLNAINFIFLWVSLCLNKVPVLLPITSLITYLINFSFMLASVIVCGVNYNTTYFPSDGVTFESNSTFAALYRIDGDMVIGPHPYKIKFASNFYVACVAAGISFVSTCFAGSFSFIIATEKRNYLFENAAE